MHKNTQSSEEIVHEGWLVKAPPEKHLRTRIWRRRWFVLKPTLNLPHQFVLEYYVDDTKHKRKGTIDLDQCQEVGSELHVENKNKFLFNIRTPQRTYVLSADTRREMARWVECLCNVCGLQPKDGNQPNSMAMTTPPQNVTRTQPVGGPKPSTLQRPQPLVLSQSRTSPTSVTSPSTSSTRDTSPYIPISECVTGKPMSAKDFYDTPKSMTQAADLRAPDDMVKVARRGGEVNNNGSKSLDRILSPASSSSTGSGNVFTYDFPRNGGTLAESTYNVPRGLQPDSAYSVPRHTDPNSFYSIPRSASQDPTYNVPRAYSRDRRVSLESRDNLSDLDLNRVVPVPEARKRDGKPVSVDDLNRPVPLPRDRLSLECDSVARHDEPYNVPKFSESAYNVPRSLHSEGFPGVEYSSPRPVDLEYSAPRRLDQSQVDGFYDRPPAPVPMATDVSESAQNDGLALVVSPVAPPRPPKPATLRPSTSSTSTAADDSHSTGMASPWSPKECTYDVPTKQHDGFSTLPASFRRELPVPYMGNVAPPTQQAPIYGNSATVPGVGNGPPLTPTSATLPRANHNHGSPPSLFTYEYPAKQNGSVSVITDAESSSPKTHSLNTVVPPPVNREIKPKKSCDLVAPSVIPMISLAPAPTFRPTSSGSRVGTGSRIPTLLRTGNAAGNGGDNAQVEENGGVAPHTTNRRPAPIVTNASLPPAVSEIQYLDLALEAAAEVPGSSPRTPNERSAVAAHSPNLTSSGADSASVYRKVDFVKTKALNETRQNVELSYRTHHKDSDSHSICSTLTR